MAVLTVSGVLPNERATSDRIGLNARPFEPTTLTANIRAGMAAGRGALRGVLRGALRFSIRGILLE
ncbi:hypothetical protein LMG3481_05011 [Achromobacter deleyi]|nr:hypothetical protein LMG3481_05011 [Achromobacter deleyi]